MSCSESLLGRPVTALSVVLALACGEVSDPPGSGLAGRGGGGGGGTGQAGAAGRGGGGAGGEGGRAGAVDAGADTGAPSGGSGGGVPAGCPSPAPIPPPGQGIVIHSINFNSGEIVLKNVSASVQTIASGRQGAQWCNYPYYWQVAYTEEDVVLAPGATFAFVPVYNTMGPWLVDREGGEMAILFGSQGFTDPDNYRAFVSWGDTDSIREPIAVQAGLWAFDERIDLGRAAGFVLVGDATRAAGYEAVPARCLVAPPNP